MKTLYTGISLPDPTFVHTPLIAIQPLADDSGLRAAACTLDAYDYLLFTSRHAVYALTPYVTALPQALRVVSIGSTTTEALRQTGIIEEVGFFRGDKKTAEEIEGFKKELTDIYWK